MSSPLYLLVTVVLALNATATDQDPAHANTIKELRLELDRVIAQHGDGKPDEMPIDQGIKSGLPDKAIR